MAHPCRTRPSRIWILATARTSLVVAITLLSGCDSIFRAYAIHTRKPLRDASLESWRGTDIDGQSAKSFAIERAGIILVGVDRVDMALTDRGTATSTGSFRNGKPHAIEGQSSAAALTDDGYFVTAAHCLPDAPDDPFVVVVLDEMGLPVSRACRVVYSGWDREEGWHEAEFADFAIIHAEGVRTRFFEWASADQLKPDAAVLVLGNGYGDERAAGGFFDALLPPKRAAQPAHLGLFVFRAPIIPGDSGGATILSDGSLIGVASEVNWDFCSGRWTCFGVRADPAWVAEVISRDRAERAATAKPSTP
ncbi:MAG: Trypsin-like peptidase domain [Planctomycetota bacterium]|jgi:hypothetical protein